MGSQEKTQLIQMLAYILIPIVIAIFALIGFWVYLYFKEKNAKENKNINSNNSSGNSNVGISSQNKQSIFNFMEFDTVRDNMIIQKNGTRFLMVIECQGINYDLMSGVEKASVEEGFVQFLNTLRHKIQIYIQTRSINLESSLEVYRQKVKEVEMKLRNMQMQYEQMRESGEYTDEQLARAFFEVTKQSNLYEYGKSVLQDTEKMSLNKSILNKKYYIIVPYYAIEAGGVRGKILKSNELTELLYMAYNRDEAETFGLDKALKAGFDEMYSTAPDVLKKKMQELDRMIEEKAIEKAREKINEVRSELQQQVEEKEENMDDLIDDLAKATLEENEKYIGKDVKEQAIENIEKESTKAKKGGKADGKKTATRTRKKSTTI